MKSIFYTIVSFMAFIPVAALAQNNLVNLPIGQTDSFNDYINAVYLMFISIAALIAVIKIIIAGVKYMFSDIVTQKSQAKNDIKGALLGLLVVLSAVLILSVINPQLTRFNPDITRNQARQAPVQQPSAADKITDHINATEAAGGLAYVTRNSSEAEKVCESVDKSKCRNTGGGKWSGGCYVGEYEAQGDHGVCTVTATKKVREDERLDCNVNVQTGQTPPGNSCKETGICPSGATYTYDCTAAEARCTAAGYVPKRPNTWFGLGSPSESQVDCVAPTPPAAPTTPIPGGQIISSAGQAVLDEYLANTSGVSSVVSVYATNITSGVDGKTLGVVTNEMIEGWAEDCEGDNSGNTFVETKNTQTATYVRACVN